MISGHAALLSAGWIVTIIGIGIALCDATVSKD
jgi:hypothetical protein